jgi:hypothetical protein
MSEAMEYFNDQLLSGHLNAHKIDMKSIPDAILNRLSISRDGQASQDLTDAVTLLCTLRKDADPGQKTARTDEEEIPYRIQLFGIACAFERMRRQGRIDDIEFFDPLDPEAGVKVSINPDDELYKMFERRN